MSAEALMSDIRQCTLCREALPLTPKPVLQADSRSRILIAAQAPGKLAHSSGKPFDDPSGDRLRHWLGVDREAFYNPALFALVPMGFCYPGTRPGGDLPPRPECAHQWRSQLLAQLTEVKLTLVIGQYAQAWHLPNSGHTLTQTVARWRDFWPERLPLPHPSGRNNRWLKINPWFEAEVIPALQARVKALMTDAL